MASINPSLETTHPTTTTTTTTTTTISELLSELARAISEREGINDDHPTPGIDPAVLQQLQAVSAHMQTMNERLSTAVWQIDNGVHGRMDGLERRLDSIGSGLKILVSRSDGKITRESEKTADLRMRKTNHMDKLVPLHNSHTRPIANFTADTPYKLARGATRRDIKSGSVSGITFADIF